MKKIKIIYWVSTVMIAIMMVFSAFSYLTSDAMEKIFQHLGFSGSFRIELAVAKILGVIMIILPVVHPRIKEWAYAGFTIVFISAVVAHLSSGDGMAIASFPIVMLGILSVSYISYHKLIAYDKKKQVYIEHARARTNYRLKIPTGEHHIN